MVGLGCVQTCLKVWIGAAEAFGRVWAHVLVALGCVQTCFRAWTGAAEVFGRVWAHVVSAGRGFPPARRVHKLVGTPPHLIPIAFPSAGGQFNVSVYVCECVCVCVCARAKVSGGEKIR